jgi:hypothetical protein
MVLKIEYFGEYIRNTWQVLKCGAGEGWRRSVGTVRGKNEVLQTVKEKSNIVHRTKRRKANWSEHILHRYNF